MPKQRKIRAELEGLRAIAAILVAIYHIWFNRVSGGVDVFFVVSGFLITTSLLSMYKRNGKILYFSYVVKLLKRLIPTAWVIGIITFLASLVLLPLFTRYQVLSEFLASAFYFQNWRLAIDAVDYLAQNNDASPYQHFWALSIQFQFYLLWLILFFVAVSLRKLLKIDMKKILIATISIVIAASLTYSIYLTSVNQPVAYYHTFTRVWEFGIGGILSLVIHRITVKKPIAWVMGWAGLIGLLSGGILFQVSDVFPGYAALWPVLSAVFIIIAGNHAERFSAYKVLSWKPFVKFGGISYAFYLWHWPLLIFYYAYFDVENVSILNGLAIMVIAAILAYLTIALIEKPIRTAEIPVWKTAGAILAFSSILLISTQLYQNNVLEQKEAEDVSGSIEIAAEDTDLVENEEPVVVPSNPGALIKAYSDDLQGDQPFDAGFLPRLDNASQDRADIYPDSCILGNKATDPRVCEYGDVENYTKTISLVGGSHAAHWHPMLMEAMKDENIRIKTYLKGNCRFTTKVESKYTECNDWFANVTQLLIEDKPDLIFSVGDAGKGDDHFDVVPEGFIDAWELFDSHDIPLFLVRDTPWYSQSVLKCINDNVENPEECKEDRDEVIRDPSPMSLIETFPDNVTTMDLTDYFCDEEYCYYVVGNVITHFDSNHLTATFSRTLAPIMKDKVMEALGETSTVTDTDESDLPISES
ncbi:acyltransferase family protein [Jeotgalibacillus sp. ET6]|uniref:acyltransferase family protein n=1 Tax=Jeotgalibacillus sp. ET6 TaxID=3037260 RepID=UPI002418AFBF|nr:acyltransferase family protein [Jeotgalibacillus sp. ET6]MDG5472325.1 acyltransferase family protein [Jeotgalibacillus sp. ET6]